jgi:hypothetical protein
MPKYFRARETAREDELDGLQLASFPRRAVGFGIDFVRVSLWQSLERALGYGASFLEGGFGFAQYFFQRNQQCAHDRLAEMIVEDSVPRAQAAEAS